MNPRNPQIQRRRQSQYRGIQYNYSTAAGDTFDFSKIGEQYTRNKEFQLAAKEKIRERLQKETEQLQDATKYEATGVAEADKLAMGVSNDIRTSLLESKKMVGQFDEDLGRVRTLKDHNELYNNLNNSAKSYAVFNEHVTKEAERIMEDPKLSGAQKEAFALSLGNVHNKAKTTQMFVDPKTGRLGMGVTDRNPNEKGEKGFQAYSVGELMFNTKNDIALFDPVADVAALQDVYADKLKTAGYSQETVGDLKVFSTEHILGQTEGFTQMKKNAIEAFGNQDEKVISYAFDNMGIGFAGGKKGAVKVNKLDENGNPVLGEDGEPEQIELALTTDFEGNVMVPDEVREQAKRHYSQMVDAAFGVKTTLSGQVIKAPSGRGGGRGSQQETTNFVSKGRELNQSAGGFESEFTQASFDTAFSLDGAGGDVTEGQVFDYSTADPLAQNRYRRTNPDLLNANGTGLAIMDKVPSVEELTANPGDYKRVNSLSVDFGAKTSKTDVLQKTIQTRGGRQLQDFTGFAFVEQAIKVKVKDPSDPTKLIEKVQYVPTSISLTGTVIDEKRKEKSGIEGIKEGVKSALGITNEEKEVTSEGVKSHSSISKQLNADQFNTLIGNLNDSHPGFSKVYDRQLAILNRSGHKDSYAEQGLSFEILAMKQALEAFKRG